MAHFETKHWIIIIVVGMILLYGYFSDVEISGTLKFAGETVTRQLPSYMTPNSNFNVVYSASKDNTKWAVPIEETITGGCSPTSVKTVIIHDIGEATTLTKTYTFTSPSSGSCTFTGFWTDSANAVHNFPTTTIPVSTCNTQCTTCEEMLKSFNDWVIFGKCSNSQYTTCKTNLINNYPSEFEKSCIYHDVAYCGNYNKADTNCDNCIATSELIPFINKWINNEIATSNLITSINAWMGTSC